MPDSFTEHVKLMFDLQALAFAGDITRVFSFKMGRDGSSRVYPESGVNAGFHPASHHGEREERVREFAKINNYHVSLLPYFLDKLKNTPDGDGNLLDNTLVIYGSPMGNSNVHNHKRCPLFLAGHAGGKLKGGLHLKAPTARRWPTRSSALMHVLGLDDLKTFGDSTGALDLNAAPDDHGRAVGDTAMRLRQRGRRWCAGGARRPADDGGAARRQSPARGTVADAAMQGDREAVRALLQAGRRRQRGAGRRHDGAALGGDARATPSWRRCCSTPAPT